MRRAGLSALLLVQPPGSNPTVKKCSQCLSQQRSGTPVAENHGPQRKGLKSTESEKPLVLTKAKSFSFLALCCIPSYHL